MNLHHRKASTMGVPRKTKRRTLLTDPMGIVLLLGSTAAMMMVALFKAQGLPSRRPRDAASQR